MAMLWPDTFAQLGRLSRRLFEGVHQVEVSSEDLLIQLTALRKLDVRLSAFIAERAAPAPLGRGGAATPDSDELAASIQSFGEQFPDERGVRIYPTGSRLPFDS